MSWWIGGGVAGTISVIILVCIFYKRLTESEVPPATETNPPVKQTKAQPATETNPPVEQTKAQPDTETNPPVEQTKVQLDTETNPPVNQTKAQPDTETNPPVNQTKVEVGGECRSGEHDECVDVAVCRSHMGSGKEEFICKALLGEKCTIDSHCWQERHVFKSQVICVQGECQVLAKKKGDCTPPALAVGSGPNVVCKGNEGMRCGSLRDTAIHKWCADGLKCVKDPTGKGWKDWTCKTAATVGAQIQLGESMDTWHAANRSRLMRSINLRTKRTQTSGFLQVDSD